MDARQFLETLWGENPPGNVLIWTMPENRSFWYFRFDTLHLNVNRFQDRNVYTGVGLAAREARIPNYRALQTQVVAGIAGMWADVDITHPLHSKSNLPPTMEDALSLLRDIPEQPTIIVNSGHGLQVWWLFHEPWMFSDDEERTQARTLAQWWHHYLLQRFQARGWTLDAKHNISSIMRLPGTINNKDRQNPVPVTVIKEDGPRYHRPGLQHLVPDDFTPIFAAPTDTGKNNDTLTPAVRGKLILNPQASPPPLALQALIDNDLTFRRTWEHNRPDMTDDSASAYDMSLARTAARYEWSDQEIVDLLIAWRRQHGLDLKLRQSYFQVTIDKARTPSVFAAIEQRVQRASDEISQAELHEAARSDFAQIRAQEEALRSQDTPTDPADPALQQLPPARTTERQASQPASPREHQPADPGTTSGASPPGQSTTPPADHPPQGDTQGATPPGGATGPLPITPVTQGAVPSQQTSRPTRAHRRNQKPEQTALSALKERAGQYGADAATDAASGGLDTMEQQPATQEQPLQPEEVAEGMNPAGTPREEQPSSEPWLTTRQRAPLTPEQLADRDQLLSTISAALKIDILRIVKYIGDPPTYWMDTSQGSITIGEAGHIIRCSSFQEAVAAATNVLIPNFRTKDWHNVAAALLTCCEEVDVGEASEPAREAWSWITNYLADGPIIEDTQEAVNTTTPFFKEGHIHIFLDAFRRWVEYHTDVKLNRYHMGQRLRQCLAAPAHVSYKRNAKWTTMACWKLPKGASTQ